MAETFRRFKPGDKIIEKSKHAHYRGVFDSYLPEADGRQFVLYKMGDSTVCTLEDSLELLPDDEQVSMNIYLLSRPEGNDASYDEYIGAVVIAPDEDTARHMHPYTGETLKENDYTYGWPLPEMLVVTWIGIPAPEQAKDAPKVVLSSNVGS